MASEKIYWRVETYSGLNELMPLLSAAVLDMPELQFQLESKAANWYVNSDLANALFLIPSAIEFAFLEGASVHLQLTVRNTVPPFAMD